MGGGLTTAKSNPKEIYILRGSDNPLEYDAITPSLIVSSVNAAAN
ncbi:MAG: hypothetical protein AB7U46_03985 [Paenirhodobacter sp.]